MLRLYVGTSSSRMLRGSRHQVQKTRGAHKAIMKNTICEQDVTRYRILVARCNYLVPDRFDMAFAVEELARSMSSQTQGDWTRFKRLRRYLGGKWHVRHWFAWQPSKSKLVTYSDADWAGCRTTRKFTTGGVVIVGQHMVTGWRKTQILIALSPGAPELYGTLKAAAETFGFMAICEDFRFYNGWRDLWGCTSSIGYH